MTIKASHDNGVCNRSELGVSHVQHREHARGALIYAVTLVNMQRPFGVVSKLPFSNRTIFT